MKTEENRTEMICPVPVEERCCCVTLYRAMENNPAIVKIAYDTATAALDIEHSVGAPPVETAMDELIHSLSERRAVCRDRDARGLRRGCGYCVQQLKKSQQNSHAAVTCDSVACTALSLLERDAVQFHGGVMTLESPHQKGSTEAATTTVTRKTIDPPQRALEQAAVTASPNLLRRLFSEPALVAVTLLALIVGAILERTLGLATAPTIGVYLLGYLSGGYFGLRAGMESLREHKIDIDLLMILAALGAAAIGAPFEGVLLLFLFSLSNVLQDFALDRTRNAIRSLSRLRPESANVLSGPEDTEGMRTPVEEIHVDDLILVRPGDRIPLDGTVYSGSSAVDQSTITGESMPVDRSPGDDVLAGTINQNGRLVVQVRRGSSESTIAKVIKMVEEARENVAKTERFLDAFEQYYAIGVILTTILVGLLPPFLLSWSWSESLYKAITLMVAASPCALIISTPASILSAMGNGARRGILFKGGVHVEQAALIRVVAFDKTGTLTEGKPRLSDVIAMAGLSEDDVLRIAAALEAGSEHVIATAIREGAAERTLSVPAVTEFNSTSGVGVSGIVEGREVRLGSPRLLEETSGNAVPHEQVKAARAVLRDLEEKARTAVVLLQDDGSVLGVLAVQDRIRSDASTMIRHLKRVGVTRVVMLTGDNQRTAEAIGREAGVDEVFAELLPGEKLDTIQRIEKRYGPTAMVGDGVNDAPALAGARLGIAMGAAGTDVALETADVVLLSDDLGKLPYLIELSRRTRRTLVTNLAVAMGLIAMMVVAIYTIDLPLPLAVVGHEGGTVLVSLNGLRLLMFRGSRG